MGRGDYSWAKQQTEGDGKEETGCATVVWEPWRRYSVQGTHTVTKERDQAQNHLSKAIVKSASASHAGQQPDDNPP